ncbi:MAG: hypothetical protein Ta2F_05670 [Termitinemataceae bacterium]|nr:MAG: hypothetical protein Ta2F_05670 [Termitinemataceae bacterium]
MYYTNDFIDGLIPKLKVPIETYAENSAKEFSKILNSDKKYYKKFGVYWWAVKDALRKYMHNGKWYCGGADDPLMKERAWHGDLNRTVLAAGYYFGSLQLFDSMHQWTDNDGVEHDYKLYDEDAGF